MSVKTKFLASSERDKSIDWERKVLSTRALVLDLVYLLGISIDEKKYAHADGFEKFLTENGVTIELVKEKVEK